MYPLIYVSTQISFMDRGYGRLIVEKMCSRSCICWRIRQSTSPSICQLCGRIRSTVIPWFLIPQSEGLTVPKILLVLSPRTSRILLVLSWCHRVEMIVWLPQSVDSRLYLAGTGLWWVYWRSGASALGAYSECRRGEKIYTFKCALDTFIIYRIIPNFFFLVLFWL